MNSGNSVIHRNLNPSFRSPRAFPSSRRICPSISHDFCQFSPAIIKRASPSFICERSLSLLNCSSLRNFTSGPLNTPSLNWKFAMPFAPRSLALFSQSEKSLRESSAPPESKSPFIVPPFATKSAKGFSPSAKTSSRLTIVISIRKSGLSLPYRFIASFQVKRINGFSVSTSKAFLNS